MQNHRSEDKIIHGENDKKHAQNYQIDQVKEKQKVSDEIFSQNIIENIHPSFDMANYINQKSSQMAEQNQQKKSHKHQRSIFHNFQKHLVITLRKNIKIKKSSSKNQVQQAAGQIWENFINQSRVYTKSILHILFGVVDYEGCDLGNIYDEGIVEKFGYATIFSRYSEQSIMSAQEFLRLQVIKQIKKMDLRQVMSKRRLANIDGFIEYVKEFVGELQEGPMRKRLPKNKKAEMKLQKVSREK